MSPETENCMKWSRQNHEQGTKSRSKPARAQGCAQCAHPLWPDKHAMSGLYWLAESRYPRVILEDNSA